MSDICVTSYKSFYLTFIFQRLFLFSFSLCSLSILFPTELLKPAYLSFASLEWIFLVILQYPKVWWCFFPSALDTEYILCQMVPEHIRWGKKQKIIGKHDKLAWLIQFLACIVQEVSLQRLCVGICFILRIQFLDLLKLEMRSLLSWVK